MSDRSSPFWVFNSRIDAEAIVRAHEQPDRRPVPDRLVNYLGVKIDPAFVPHVLTGRAGEVEHVPIPANWHADISEWAGALRAVDLAREVFRVVELGCGWACWLVNTGTAARAKGLEVELIGVEADDGHAAFGRQSCLENGFSEEQFRIQRAIVGGRPGTALFPHHSAAGSDWGRHAIINGSEAETEAARQSGFYDELPVVRLSDLLTEGKIDLLHIDIQGAEADFIDTCIEDINRIVGYMVVGTHSRQIEGRIFSTMLNAGWILEIERPAILDLKKDAPDVIVDGVQAWRNPRLVNLS